MIVAKVIFWISALGLFYIYLGYPLLVWLLARLFPKPVRKGETHDPFSVVIVAYNEAEKLPAKIDSILRCRDEGLLREIVIASDGSTDGTAERVRKFKDPRIRVEEWSERRGKPAVLNDVLPSCETDLVVLTDARQELHPDALLELASNFADERVGVVSGELIFVDEAGTPAASGMGAYWRYEKMIRRSEGRFSSVPGATGALYAMRTQLFSPIPATTLIDDVVIPMQAIARGRRCVFDDRATVYDQPSQTESQEAVRKRRTIGGVAQLLRLYPQWLLPWRNPIWFQYVSHKVGRLASPILLLIAGVCSVGLSRHPIYFSLAVLQAVFYLSAGVGWVCQKRGCSAGLLGMPLVFVSLNLATLLALKDALTGDYNVTWSR